MYIGIIELLNTGEHYNISDRVEIAKGKHKLPTTWRDVWYKIKRHAWQTNK